VPELPEVQAHAERVTDQFRGAVLERFVPFNFTALKTAVPRP
jgi:formamidopyrimidine-DNA glycosylase